MKTNRRTNTRRWRLAKHPLWDYLHFREILVTALLTLIPLPGLSASQIILILHHGNSSVYENISSTILSDLESICAECRTLQIKHLDIDDTPIDEILRTYKPGLKLIVTIGVKAAQLISKSETTIPKLYTLIPKSSAVSLNLDETSNRVSVIYLDQPITRQLNLIKLIMRDNQVLGVLLGPATTASRMQLESAAKNIGVPLLLESVTKEGDVGPALRRVLDGSDMLLALPDPVIYNRNTIFNILLSSYHNQIPVVGFSASYVKAGAMLAVHSTPSDIAMHIAESIRQFVFTGGIRSPEYPRYFSIEINRNVARSLNINLPESTELKQHLEQLEGK